VGAQIFWQTFFSIILQKNNTALSFFTGAHLYMWCISSLFVIADSCLYTHICILVVAASSPGVISLLVTNHGERSPKSHLPLRRLHRRRPERNAARTDPHRLLNKYKTAFSSFLLLLQTQRSSLIKQKHCGMWKRSFYLGLILLRNKLN
jgi:hypothetical protein